MADVSNFSTVLGAGYSNTHVSDFDVSANDWTFFGAAAIDTDVLHNMSVQGDLGYQSITNRIEHDGGFHVTSVAGEISPFWKMDWGRLGAVAGFNREDYYGAESFNTEHYGVYGEWYVLPELTLSAKGGGYNVDYYGEHESSGYVGGRATWYAMPDLALNGNIDYTDLTHGSSETDYGITAEWLVSETTPISIYGGWEGSSIHNYIDDVSPTGNTWLVGVKWYTNTNGATTLVDRQRSGSTMWNTSFDPKVLDVFP
jgi:hypothetical protein